MKTLTSAAANKLLRSYDEEKLYLTSMERETSTYILAETEKNQEPPAYDYQEVSDKLEELNRKICTVKHAINVFNVSTKLDGFDMTIDEALVRLSILSRTKLRLDGMRKRQPKARANYGYGRSASNLIEYEYVNYDLEQVRSDFEKVSDEISRIQMALDYCNQTITFEVDVD